MNIKNVLNMKESYDEGMPRHTLLDKTYVDDLDFEHSIIKGQKKGNDRVYYYDIPCAYDIETSSFYDESGRKTVVTYSHALNIDGYCFLMRQWGDLVDAIGKVSAKAGLNKFKRMVIYVHNLAYEFQFIKKHFSFEKVFSNGKKKNVLTALTTHGIEFRCSAMLSGSNLANWAKNLTMYKISKMKGDLDYELVRSPETPITEEELGYILNDVLIIEYGIREAIDEKGDITKLPLTNTGYVREYTRQMTIKGSSKSAREYRLLMQDLTLELEEYKALRLAFGGGFTHANVIHAGKTQRNITARDFVSSYPGRMITYKYPMGKGELVKVRNKREFKEQLDHYCCLFYVKFKGLVRTANEGYLSAGKAVRSSRVETNNGRVETADSFELWMTDMDFECMQLSYSIIDFEILKLYRYKAGYLPTSIIEAIVKLFEDKTQLKGVKGSEADYVRSKGMLNSLYGMCVMDIIQDSIEWDDVTKTSTEIPGDIAELLKVHNNKKKRFLSYPWGVWITAYARYDLFRMIVALGDSYVYADTDSIYYLETARNKILFDQENDRINHQLKTAADYHGIDVDRFSPVDPKGNRHTIGTWSHDGFYHRFKSLGAKRYMVEFTNDEGELEVNITVSGVNKSVAVPYLKETYGVNMFNAFEDNLEIPAGYCGKKTHSYIDDTREGVMTDYLGNKYEYVERSGVHLEETHYKLSISDEYSELIEMLQEKYAKEKVSA